MYHAQSIRFLIYCVTFKQIKMMMMMMMMMMIYPRIEQLAR